MAGSRPSLFCLLYIWGFCKNYCMDFNIEGWNKIGMEPGKGLMGLREGILYCIIFVLYVLRLHNNSFLHTLNLCLVCKILAIVWLLWTNFRMTGDKMHMCPTVDWSGTWRCCCPLGMEEGEYSGRKAPGVAVAAVLVWGSVNSCQHS